MTHAPMLACKLFMLFALLTMLTGLMPCCYCLLQDEFHSRLKFNRRGLVGMANAATDDNGSQFFITLGRCDELAKKHTLFGKVREAHTHTLTHSRSHTRTHSSQVTHYTTCSILTTYQQTKMTVRLTPPPKS